MLFSSSGRTSSELARGSRYRGFARIASVFGALLALSVAQTVLAQGTNRLEKIDSNVLAGDKVELKLTLSGTAPQPLSFTVDNPARIALDIPDTSIAMTNRRIDVKHGVLDTVNV